ncbi:TonB-dependent receptor [Fodinibius halophilus]|uniref:TonB-dependent receptor n=1 Tax=Fodinibius halophilus TaxID=1736908 RepID=A0A6M1SUU0_9BACT|nr:TonB-dependent receptor [Fodinibius halophilus]NGP87708.1 TonB-dependent receptor [Fodinibius halophilus]
MNNINIFFKTYFLTVGLFFCFSVLAHAQIGKITGRVISAESGNPLEGVNAGLSGTTMGTATNKEGLFTIDHIPEGRYTIIISSIGYKQEERKITIESGDILSLDIRLKKTISALDEVIVTGLSESEELELTAKAVDAVELADTKFKTTDLGDVMAQTKGVNVRRSGGLGSSSRFSLNGLTDDQIRFFLDGVPLEFSGYSFGISNVPVNLIKRVEIYKGVVPIRFGTDALGGAVNLVAPKEHKGIHGSVSYQTGSFGTNRAAANINYLNKDTGFFFNGSGFYDYAKNDYKIDVEIPDQSGKLEDATVKRFHDSYTGYGTNLKLGVQDKSWTNKFSVKAYIADYDKDIQHNNVMSVPYGEVTSGKKSYGIAIHYDKVINRNLSLKLKNGYSYDIRSFADTSRYIYNWHGEPVRDSNGNIRERGTPGELGKAADQVFWDRNYYNRLNINYQLDTQHEIHLSSAPTYVRRTGNERWQEEFETVDPLNDVRTVFNWVNGIEHSWSSADGKIENDFFIKGYMQNIKAEEQTNGAPINRNRSFRTIGFGNNIRYTFNKQWLVKASYEWATRLPKTEELFGNGSLVRPNLSLEPEKSHNANLAFNYRTPDTESLTWNIKLNGFLRSTDRLIVLLSDRDVYRYQNVFSAVSTGIEVSGSIKTRNNRFQLKGNTTWQSFRNQSTKGQFGRFKGDRIPNRPYFFANLMAQYKIPQPFTESDRIKLFLSNRYVHEFYRGWESVGLKRFKDTIPSQFTQNLGATYDFPIESATASFTAEVQNITNADTYDFFGIQKPGRAFYLKITTQF